MPQQAAVQELKDLREDIKTKMATCLTELRNMQALEDLLEAAEVRLPVSCERACIYGLVHVRGPDPNRSHCRICTLFMYIYISRCLQHLSRNQQPCFV